MIIIKIHILKLFRILFTSEDRPLECFHVDRSSAFRKQVMRFHLNHVATFFAIFRSFAPTAAVFIALFSPPSTTGPTSHIANPSGFQICTALQHPSLASICKSLSISFDTSDNVSGFIYFTKEHNLFNSPTAIKLTAD